MLENIKKKFILIISGSVGSGKTTVGSFLKEKFPRTAVFDMDIIKWQISDFQRGDRDNAIVRKGVYSLASNYCKHGLNIIIPQTMLQEEPQKYKELAKEFGYLYIQIELYASDSVIMNRVMEKQKNNPHPTTKERILQNIAWYKKTTDSEVVLLDTSNLIIDEVNNFVLKTVLERLKNI